MNMKQISIGLLLIIFTNKQIKADGIQKSFSPITFANVKSVYIWSREMHKVMDAIRDSNDLSDDSSQKLFIFEKNFESQLSSVKTANLELNNFNSILESSLKDVGTGLTHLPRENPIIHIEEMKEIYNELIKRDPPGQNPRQSQELSPILSTYKTRIQNVLEQLETSIVWITRPNIITDPKFTAGQFTSQKFLTSECESHYSKQQGLYYFYVELILTELKGFASLQRIYTEMKLNGKDVNNDVQIAFHNFARRLKLYNRKLVQLMSLMPQQIFKCQVENTKKSTLTDLHGFSQIRMFELGSNMVCKSGLNNCETLHKTTTTETIYNCKEFDRPMKVCKSFFTRGQSRIFDWFEDNKHVRYGIRDDCISNIISYEVSSNSCPVCLCSKDLEQYRDINGFPISAINVADVVADINQNMVVTGVKIEIFKNMIQLKIQQGQLFGNLLQPQKRTWKQILLPSIQRGQKDANIVALQHNRKTIYLDDVKVADGYVVTGVRFKMVKYGFTLEVHGTLFDIGTGKLDTLKSRWFDSTTSINPTDYKRERIEIEMNNVNNPLVKGVHFELDRESNKFVKFTHTGLESDAGQTTIPLLDSNPVESPLSFPLSGVGLSYRHSESHGGYISPSIFTLDLVPYMKMEVGREDCRKDE